MPPKAKFSKEQVVSAALGVVEECGPDGLTAREVGRRLNSSARPIFTVFDGMDTVRAEVIAAAKRVYDEYVEAGLKEYIAFKGVGKAYIRFAVERPKLFMLLFMCEHGGVPEVGAVLPEIDDNAERILDSIVNGYGVSREFAKQLYLHLWIYTHGIATLVATGVCKFTSEETESMLTDVFVGVFTKLKGEMQ